MSDSAEKTDRQAAQAAAVPPRRSWRKSRLGATLIEAVLWLVVVAVVLGGILAVYTTVTNNQREAQTRQLVQTIIASVRSLYAGSINYTGLAASVLVAAGDIPTQWTRGTGATATIETPDGDAVTLGGWDGGWGVALAGLREEVCIAVLQDFLDNDDLEAVDVEAAVPAAINDAATTGAMPATIGAISTSCIANQNVTLEFR